MPLVFFNTPCFQEVQKKTSDMEYAGITKAFCFTHLPLLIFFYTPWKHKKLEVFWCFQGLYIERDHWHKMVLNPQKKPVSTVIVLWMKSLKQRNMELFNLEVITVDICKTCDKLWDLPLWFDFPWDASNPGPVIYYQFCSEMQYQKW